MLTISLTTSLLPVEDGRIFRARDTKGNIVAIKEILPEFATDWSIIDRIEKEVKFLVRIDHPLS